MFLCFFLGFFLTSEKYIEYILMLDGGKEVLINKYKNNDKKLYMGEFFGNNKIRYDHIRAPIVSEFALYFIQSEYPLEVNPDQIEHLRSSNGVDRQIHECQRCDGIHWHPTRS